ncbi:putative peptide modification system cyclase [Tahibacter aquaticus]|uniref:Putative peptide modification system cyclase n=1 Tax=Tahibacter aquaticus TaxID=520092 RepID=A0A4R6YSY7_9GAMM|nr:putative peptide modification system cyclase [Tahibacter aquaticus]TDR41202.1 putative peptide modification system cyclase [Tahibacter aquaticus]
MRAVEAPELISPPPGGMPVLRTLALCDLVDSTSLVERLGDQAAAALLRRHDRVARDLVLRHYGHEIDKTDGFLVLFERPVQAIAFALAYQRALCGLSREFNQPLRARIGLHVGDVLLWQNSSDDVSHGAKPVELEGLVKPVTARLAGLALPGQILMSGVAAFLAQRPQQELGPASVRWINHGRYRFKGVPEPLHVYEVGETGVAPLRAPPYSGKAWREVPWWRRPASLAIEASLLLVLLLMGAWSLLRPEPAIAFAERDWVVMGSLANLTGETRFDDALPTAFRIGLEQSGHVNVVADLQVRNVLQRMERDPASTPVDRQVGAEIALRDGARAVILPSLAEIGGRLRVTAEVIDPKTQATVYSETSDGLGPDSVVESVDRVVHKLRARLGEVLIDVSSPSERLDKVTTANVEALRAYSLGERERVHGNLDEAIVYFEHALQLDEHFAAAMLGVAKAYHDSGKPDQAQQTLERAASLRSRLSSRDSLHVDAMQASLRAPAEALVKWRVLARLHPDFYPGHGALAYFGWRTGNRFDEAIAAAQRCADPHNPHAAAAQLLLGLLQLGQEHFADSAASLRAAAAAGFSRPEYLAATQAAQRQFSQAQATLAQLQANAQRAGDPEIERIRLTVAADRGDAKQVQVSYKALCAAADSSPTPWCHSLGLGLAAAGLLEAPATGGADAAGGGGQADARFIAAADAYWHARSGNAAAARARLQQAVAPDTGNYPSLAGMREVAAAEISRAAGGDAAKAVAQLRKLVDGDELLLTHIALLDALRAGKDWAGAREQAQWLTTRRGRAYAEYNGDWLLNPFYAAYSNLAQLDLAEIELAAGNRSAARAALAQFRSAWPQAAQRPALAGRLDKLETALR